MDARKPRERLLGPALRTQPDRRLVALARDGSEPAQEEIVRRYRAGLVRYAGSIVGAAAAEDVVQEALAKGMTALGRAGDELRLRPWLYAVVRNTALNHLRDAAPPTDQLDENYDGVEQPPQALERRELVRSLVGGLRGLPRQQREALVKRELEGRSHEEIGAELGVSSGAARQLIFRARESLRVGFGSLLPMPLLRWLAEGGSDGAVGVAAGAGGGALAAKAAVAVFAAGAAVTAGVAIDHGGNRRPQPPAAEAAVRPAPPPRQPAVVTPQTAPRTESVVASPVSGSGKQGGSSGPGGGSDSSSGPGPGEQRAVEGSGGPGPSGHSGPGPSGGGDSSDGGGHGDRSGHGGPSGSGGAGDDSGSGSSNSGRDGGHGGSGSDGGGSSHSGSDDSSGSGSGGSGSGSSDGSSSDGSGSDDGGDAVVPTASPAPAPSSSGPGSGTTTPATPPPVIESEPLPEASRDLSGGSVSQGSEHPD
jgi:RNA polymerase sigma factor (sigma-70 family)